MNYSKIFSAIEHALAGAALVSVPVLLSNIPQTWTNITLGTVIGLVWGLVRNYLSTVASQ